MSGFIISIFIIGYVAIAFEHNLKIDKAASALITGVLCWLLCYLSATNVNESQAQLLEHLGDIGSILFFLMGAMTIVEVIDSHQGFLVITDSIKSRSLPILLLLITIITFFLSAILDNLTTAIVMTSLSRKLIREKQDRLWFVSMVIIAANAGGAWSPLGDVTTTMLWIGGQVSAWNIIVKTFIPSVITVLLPLIIMSFRFRNKKTDKRDENNNAHPTESNVILFTGVGMLLFVPFFKTITHMPPFMGMLLALGIIWIVSGLIHLKKHPEERLKYSVTNALRKIDTASILFFLGILLAVSALQSAGILNHLAVIIANNIKNEYLTGTILGLLSSVIDNVPLVAAAQGMFSLQMFPPDHQFWEFLALAAGTGGSAIIIGSAAGVAVMGIEKVNFFWYLKNISWIALLGFAGGLTGYIVQQAVIS